MQAHDESLNLFFTPPINKGVNNSQIIEHLPISQLGSGCIEFNVSSPNYVDLSRSKLYLKCKVVIGENTTISYIDKVENYKSEGDVLPTNALFGSMFQKVDLSIQQQSVSNEIPSHCYPYKYMLDTLLNTKDDYNPAILFVKDTSSKIDACSMYKELSSNPSNGKLNLGLVKRAKFMEKGQSFELEGPIGVDFMKQNRLLLHNTNIGLKLWPSTPAFSLLSAGSTEKFNIKILEAKLKLCHVTLEPAVSVAINDVLKLKPACYPYSDSKMRTLSIPKGSQSATFVDIFGNECPNKLYLCMVKSSAAAGSFQENPYFFRHFNINEIGFYVNNIPLPSKPIQLNFGDSIYESHYLSVWEKLKEENPDSIISFEDFYRGYTIFSFDLSNRENNQELLSNSHSGSHKLELRFSEALEESIVLFAYGKYNSVLSIDTFRNVALQ